MANFFCAEASARTTANARRVWQAYTTADSLGLIRRRRCRSLPSWKVLIAYLDESYNKNFHYIAAAIGSAEAWEQLEVSSTEIKQNTAKAHGTPLDAELRGHEIMGGEGEWGAIRGKHRESAGVYLAALR